jgi:hypothetical protein
MAAKNEELGDVENIEIVRRRRSAGHEREADGPPPGANEKW